MDLDEKKNKELQNYKTVLQIKQKLEEVAKNAIDKNLIKSWYYNGKSFVVLFKDKL